MSETKNRAAMQDAFAGLARGDGGAFLRLLAEDVCWSMIGTTAWSGRYDGKEEVVGSLLGPLMTQFPQPYRSHAHRFIAEGDRVVVQCRGEAETVGGERYDNDYCWVCRFRDGRIVELTEYMDTELVTRVLVPPVRSPSAQAGAGS